MSDVAKICRGGQYLGSCNTETKGWGQCLGSFNTAHGAKDRGTMTSLGSTALHCRSAPLPLPLAPPLLRPSLAAWLTVRGRGSVHSKCHAVVVKPPRLVEGVIKSRPSSSSEQ